MTPVLTAKRYPQKDLKSRYYPFQRDDSTQGRTEPDENHLSNKSGMNQEMWLRTPAKV